MSDFGILCICCTIVIVAIICTVVVLKSAQMESRDARDLDILKGDLKRQQEQANTIYMKVMDLEKAIKTKLD